MFSVIEIDNVSKQIVVLYADGDMGFIPNSNLLHKANSITAYNHGQTVFKKFEKETEEKLLPNLLENAVVLIVNASYHSVYLNKVLNSSNRKNNILKLKFLDTLFSK